MKGLRRSIQVCEGVDDPLAHRLRHQFAVDMGERPERDAIQGAVGREACFIEADKGVDKRLLPLRARRCGGEQAGH